ncbi:autotransporter outer membrane beta-barrel domain-containing protein [Brevundimonas balnearis]|uniref:Autotransporter outer membrane beta-barrel domain-containing protein n=1 Tax=Brevundimonas balnearis TaxID=1572858 RepID=A0ABV6R007_9CAUL
MRILLATAAALAPLMAAAGAHAEVVISTNRTTAIRTSNATGSTPDNIRLASGGTITLNTGSAITIDSANSVDLDSGSQIVMERAADGAVGIDAVAGGAGDITVGGTIRITDTLDSYEDTDDDGDLDGPLAQGQNRYGVRIAGTGTYVGDVIVENSGSISVEGNNSAGILIDRDLDGRLETRGSVSVIGDDSFGIRTTGRVESVTIGANTSANGRNAVGAAIDGDVTGRVTIQGSVASTGYRYTQRPIAALDFEVRDEDLYLEDLDEDDLLQGGPAVRIAGDVGGGILLDIAPTYLGGIEADADGDGVENGDEDDDGDGTINSEDTDRDGDGVIDTEERNASITTYGGAPALLIGSSTEATNVGTVGTGDLDYGLINRGSVTALGVYDGVAATAVQLGAGQAVQIAGGVLNEGSISSTAYEADAAALRLTTGAATPRLVNTQTINATTISEGAFNATGLLIQSGAALPAVENRGTIGGGVSGEASNAYGIRDLSGSLGQITNSGIIFAQIVANDDDLDDDDDNLDPGDEEVTGQAVAIDVSASTAGVSVLQIGDASVDYLTDFDGDGTPDFEDTDDDGDGIPDAEDDDDNDDDNDGVPNDREPIISGAILFGSGADTLDVRDGSVNGDISFGAGLDRLLISGGATVSGALSDSDALLDITIADGVLDARQSTTLNLSNLNVGADGTLLVTVDPATSSGGLNVSGTAQFASGAQLGARFSSLVQGTQRLVLVQATDLQAGAIDFGDVESNSSYIYNIETGVSTTADQIFVDVRRKTAEELELIGSEAGIYDALYEALGLNESLQAAFLDQTDREGLIDLYEQMLPEHGGGALMSLASGVDAVTRALTGRNEVLSAGESSAWLQEINFYADKDKTDSYGFRSEGFGVAGGYERGTGFGNVGVSVAFTSSDIEDPEAAAEENLAASLIELGLYWRAQGQYWTTWARAAAGYAFMDSTREIVGEGLNLETEADWNGYTLAAAGGFSYRRDIGRFELRPEVYAEYFWLQEDGYEEDGAGDGFDLIVDDRSGHIFSATAAMNIGTRLGRDGWIRPELRVGWRQYLSVDSGETVGRFSGGTQQFLLANGAIEGGGPILGFRLGIGNDLGLLTIQADAESIEDYVRYSLLLRATFRF